MVDYRAVQERLIELGFDPGKVDGNRGPNTDRAVVEFKKSVGLRARPFIGPLTLAALFPKTSQSKSDIQWMTAAYAVLGLHESRNTIRLREWFDRSVSWIDPREIPWCGAFVATCHRQADPGVEVPDNPLGARAWKPWGKPCGPRFGATMVFSRGDPAGWKGHVGFYVGEDTTHFHILGGNQKNSVNVTRIQKGRFLGAVWPDAVPVSGSPIMLNPNGTPISTNEA